TNMLAAWGTEGLDRVDEIAIFVAGVDQTRMRDVEGFGTSYSIQTILEEASKPAAFFTKGKMTFVPPMSGGLVQRFPRPIGAQAPHMTLHSEVATLPDSYRHQGVQEVSFRIAFDAETTARLRFLHLLGLTSEVPVQVGDVEVRPMDLLLRLLRDAPKPQPAGPPKQVEVLRAQVTGRRGKARAGYVAECHVTGMPRWGLGIDIDTGCPPSIAVQMLASGDITARGVLPPERAVPLQPLRAALAQRGMRCSRRALAAAGRARS
ncbi:MAG TPA: saccharopine dehydrogenase C-terminal domain-containing protein, partial [Myxococcota bacterium]|nr:saccharopine dehydrogenase C-terminal domain-containing protein [Myxococcota bacterium]